MRRILLLLALSTLGVFVVCGLALAARALNVIDCSGILPNQYGTVACSGTDRADDIRGNSRDGDILGEDLNANGGNYIIRSNGGDGTISGGRGTAAAYL